MAVHRKFTIDHQIGLHARPATLLVKTAGEFEADIEIVFKEKKGNAKSLLSILGLGVKKYDQITIQIQGADEEFAMEAISNLITNNFYEPAA